ncbi:MAG: hypothetical protein HQM08_29305 [Candidatus Riflebacteria bacterium]|nr:hypothetical protein [Candidatus Riflebacteria bacterium]
MKKLANSPRKAMAIVVVVIFAAVLLVLGGSYIETVRQVQTSNPKELDRIQANFFAQGIQKLAILKFKRFPADFYHGYLHEKARLAGESVSNITPPKPWDIFLGKDNTPLQNSSALKAGLSTLSKYSTNYSLISNKDYTQDVIEIQVTVDMKTGMEYQFKTEIGATRVAL